MLRVTPIYGSTGYHPGSGKRVSQPPNCTLIEYGGVRVLVNVGYDESCHLIPQHNNRSMSTQQQHVLQYGSALNLPPELPEVDVVLLTDSSLQSLGGLPIYFNNHNSNNTGASSNKSKSKKASASIDKPAIYATFPTVKMGQMTLYDFHANVSLDGGNPGFSLSDVDSLFSSSTTASTTSTSSSNANTNTNDETNLQNDQDINLSSNLILPDDNTANTNKTTDTDTHDTNNHNQSQNIKTLKYAQTIILNDPITNKPALGITPHRAAHLIGASYYILKRLTDETEVVVAPIYHHAKEKHLDSSTLYKFGTACDVLITYPGGPGGVLAPLYNPLLSLQQSATSSSFKTITNTSTNNKNNNNGDNNSNNKKSKNNVPKQMLPSPSVPRDERELLEMILSTLRRGGNILLPVDTSGRVLELLLLLNQHWERHRLSSAYNLCWVGNMVHNTISFAKSQLEWMASPLGAQFDSGRGHPFTLKCVQMFSNVSDFELACGITSTSKNSTGGTADEIMDGVVSTISSTGGVGNAKGMDSSSDDSNPCCVLASGATLDNGPARDLFLKWCDNPDNAVILTDSRRCVLRGNVAYFNHYFNNLQQLKQQQQLITPTKKSHNKIDKSPMAIVTTPDNDRDDTPKIIPDDDHDNNLNTLSSSPSITSKIITTSTTTLSPHLLLSKNEFDMSEFSTAAQLLLKWCEAKALDEEMPDVIEVDVLVPHREPLSGSELKSFLLKEESKRLKEKAEEERRAILREVELAKGRLRLDDNKDDKTITTISTTTGVSSSTNPSSASNINQSTDGLGGSRPNNESSSRPKKRSRFDGTLFIKFSKPCHMMFEVREEAVGIGQSDSIAKYGIGESIGRAGEVLEDDYGIAVKPERFVDIVTGIEPSKYAGGKEDAIRRGLGFGSDGRPLIAGGGLNATLRGDEQGKDLNYISDLNSEYQESNLEALDLSEGTGIIRARNNRPPIKVSTKPRQVEVLAEIAYIPLEGRVDAKAARQSVRALQPRQVVILGGGKPEFVQDDDDTDVDVKNEGKNGSLLGEADILAEAIRSLAIGGRGKSIFIPTDGEMMELHVGHAAYSVRLVNTPYLTKEEKEMILASGQEMSANVELYEAKIGDCTVSILDYVATGQQVAGDGSIVLAPRRESSNKSNHDTIMLSDGDVLLTDLRSEIIAQGMKAEYSAHVGYAQLVVNGKIVVRKNQATGKIDVEGPLSEDFFLVRSVVCGQYVTL